MPQQQPMQMPPQQQPQQDMYGGNNNYGRFGELRNLGGKLAAFTGDKI